MLTAESHTTFILKKRRVLIVFQTMFSRHRFQSLGSAYRVMTKTHLVKSRLGPVYFYACTQIGTYPNDILMH